MIASTQRSAWITCIGLAAFCSPAILQAQADAAAATAIGETTSTFLQKSAPPLPPVAAKQRDKATTAYLRGAKLLELGAFPAAEQDFAQAVALNPAEPAYLAALALAREHQVTSLLQQAATQRPLNPAEADKLLAEARRIDPDNPRVLQRDHHPLAQPMEHFQSAAPIVLKPNSSTHDFHLRGDVRSLAQEIAKAYGIAVVFDEHVPMQNIRLDVDGVRFADAMRVFSAVSGTFSTPVDDHTLVVATDTVENRQRYERLVEETFYLPGTPADQLKDYVSVAQQITDIRQVSVAPLGGALVVRGPADRVSAVERIFTDLQQGTSEVLFDLKLYEVDKQHVQNLGVVLPSSLSAYSLAAEAQSIVSQNSSIITQLIASGVLPSTASTVEIAAYLVFVAGLGSSSSLLANSFLTFGGGLTTGVLSTGSIPTIDLALNNSEARTLDDLQLRVSDRQTAIFKSGMRYPIQTSLYSDIASSAASSLASTTVNGVSLSSLLASYLGTSSVGSGAVIPQIQYQDLGLTVSAIPRVLPTGDVGMKLDIKIASLAGTALNGIPILTSRQFTSDLTVHDGETVMMVSDTTRSESAAVTGLPGLSEIPGFQSTTNRDGTVITGDIVLMITPHIVRSAHTGVAGPYIPLAPRATAE
jgi:general secretion pathway protein D